MKKILIYAAFLGILSISTIANAGSTKYQESISLLSNLGAEYVQNKSENDQQNITRGEFIKILINLAMEEDKIILSGKHFSDVDSSYFAFNEINSALALGVISSDDSRIFRPNDQITRNEAVKTIVAILGYKEMAKALGDYPNGYLNAAANLGLLSGVSTSSEGLTSADAVQMFVNMLETKISEMLSDSTVVVSTSRTFLNYYRNIYVTQGIITANELTGLYDSNGTSKGTVIINNNQYYVGETDISDYLGLKLKIYYKNERGYDFGIVTHFIKMPNNNLKEITTQDSPSATDNIIAYQNEQGRIIQARISPNASVILNGVFYGNARSLDLNSLIPATGTIKLLSYDGSNAEVVFIESYIVYVAESISVGSGIIYDKYDNPPLKLLEVDEYEIRAYGEDTLYDLEFISELNVLMVKTIEATRGSRIEITIVDSPIKGALTAINNNNNNITYAVDGTEYEVSNQLLNSANSKIPDLGERAVFYVDFNGRIVGINLDVKENYGYLIAMGKSKQLDNKIELKIYTQAGEFVIYECDKTVFLDNISYSAEVFYDNMMPFKDQLVKYDYNGKGKLTSLERENDFTQVPDYVGYNEDVFSLDGVLEVESYIFRNYIRQGSVLNVTYGVSSSTVFFDIPADLSAEKRFSVATPGRFTAEGCIPIGTRVYDVGITGAAKVVLIKRAEAGVLRVVEGDKTGIFRKMVKGIDEDGDTCDGIYFYNRGTATFVSSSGVDYDNSSDYGYGIVPVDTLRDGDFMQYSVDTTGKIVSYRVIFRPSEPDLFNTRGSLWSGITSYYGQVIKAEGNRSMRYFSMMLNGKLFPFVYDYTQAKNYNSDGAYIYIYNTSRSGEKVDLGNGSEIMDGDRLFVKMYYGIGQIMIIVRD